MRAFTTSVVLGCFVLAVGSTSALGATHVYTVPATIEAERGDTIFFEVRTDDSNDTPVRAWQIWFDCFGPGPDDPPGGPGSIDYVMRPKPCEFWYDCCPTPDCDVCTDGFCEVTLAGPLVDDGRTDYIFFNIVHGVPIENEGDCDNLEYDPFIHGPRAANYAQNIWEYPTVTPDAPKYLCDWAFRVSDDAACETYTIDWHCDANDACSADRTALLDGSNIPITPLVSDPLVVTVINCPDGCPTGVMEFIDPPDGVVDARQPHPVDDPADLQGINTFTATGPEGATNLACWAACEVGGTAPAVASVTEGDPGEYTIVLDRPITTGAFTTLTYTDDDSLASTGSFISHPANANGDTAAAPSDILALIDYLNGVGDLPWGLYSCDIDHTDACNAQDILRLIDLLNGAGEYDPWNNTPRPDNDGSCP